MSRSNPTAKSPVARYFTWKGADGEVVYYDKEKGKNIVVELPFTFLVLDELSTIGGFHKPSNSGFRSNEVRDMREETLFVRNRNGVIAKGLYEGIKDEIKAKGAKYAKSIYIAFKDDTKELVIGNIQVSGAALTAWIEFSKKFNVEKVAVVIADKKAEKNGSNDYFTPVFAGQDTSEATEKESQALDRELQNYLGVRLSKAEPAGEYNADGPADEDDTTAIESEAEPINENVAPASGPRAGDKPAEDEESKPIKLSDVPF